MEQHRLTDIFLFIARHSFSVEKFLFKLAATRRGRIFCGVTDLQRTLHTAVTTSRCCMFACIKAECIGAFSTVLCFRIKAGHV